MRVNRHLRRSALALAATSLAAVAIFIVFLGNAGVTVKPVETYEVSAIAPSAIRLVELADVRQAGVKIGKVAQIRPHGPEVELLLSIERRYAPVYDNARVYIGSKSLAGENFVDLDPGAPPGRALREHATLPISRSPESTQIDQVIGVLKPKRVRDLRRIVQALGTGLGGRGERLNQLVGEGSRATVDGYDVVHAVAAERLQLTQLIDDFGRMSETLGERGRDLRRFVRGSLRMSEAFARHRESLAETLRTAPGFLRAARDAMRRASRLSAVSTPVVHDTRVAAERLVPTVERLDEASAGGRAVVRELTPFSRRSARTLRATRRFVPIALEFMRPLERSLRELNPLLGYLSPYARDLALAPAMVGATARAKDETSHLFRIVTLVHDAAAGGSMSKEELEALEALIATGGVIKHTISRGKNPYPSPGPQKAPKDFAGSYPRVTEDPPYGR